MKYLIFSLLALASFFSACQSSNPTPNTNTPATHARNPIRIVGNSPTTSAAVYDFKSFAPFLQAPNPDTLYILNFWATWCAPCVAELPYFAQAAQNNSQKPVKIILVSLDFERDLDGRFATFIKEHPYPLEKIVLLEPDPNSWIPKIDPDWDGAIPATLMYKGAQRAFFPQDFTQAELDSTINKMLSK